jgi:hypothetical protein
MSRLLVASLCLCATFSLTLHAAAQGIAQQTVPPKTGHEITPSHLIVPGATSPVRVFLLKSWGVTTGWEDLKTQWPSFGKVPITIDDSKFISTDFTYTDLVNSHADVIVLSDPAGGGKQYSADEIAAVAQYAAAGHNVLGTYAVFQTIQADNRGLMPVFGLNSAPTYSYVTISNTFAQDVTGNCLLNNISSPWQSSGYSSSQVPAAAGKWTHNAQNLAFPIADSDSNTGIITLYNGGAYTGIFISNYPEYFGGTNDLQLLYNAVTCFHVAK